MQTLVKWDFHKNVQFAIQYPTDKNVTIKTFSPCRKDGYESIGQAVGADIKALASEVKSWHIYYKHCL